MANQANSIKLFRFCASIFLIFAPLYPTHAEWKFWQPSTWFGPEKAKQPVKSIAPQKQAQTPSQQTPEKDTIAGLIKQKQDLIKKENVLSADIVTAMTQLYSLASIPATDITDDKKKEFITDPLKLCLDIFNQKHSIVVNDKSIYSKPGHKNDTFTLLFKLNPNNTQLNTYIERAKSDLKNQERLASHLQRAQKQREEQYKKFFNENFEKILGQKIKFEFDQPNYRKSIPLEGEK